MWSDVKDACVFKHMEKLPTLEASNSCYQLPTIVVVDCDFRFLECDLKWYRFVRFYFENNGFNICR
jgi:hypothetical protein